ncbi:MAG TPA: hypothetical protein VK524_15715 [Polyangiaceae bacterium]|nr:hypothetical protein [Polyangiaceae bacterium]
MPWVTARVLAVAVLAVASAFAPKLGILAAFLTGICCLSLPAGTAAKQRRIYRSLLALAAVAGAVGVLRFVVEEAVPGIVQGGKDAAAKNAVSRLRELVFAEDGMRRHAYLDHDGDGVGSAALVGELSGKAQQRPFPPILNERWHVLVETRSGSAARVGGYLYMVCLPLGPGGFGASGAAGVDAEQAERRYLAYAWPAAASSRIEAAFFIDEHERILVNKNEDGRDPEYLGSDYPPACDAALKEPADWQPWMNKKPRLTLPGDDPGPKLPR